MLPSNQTVSKNIYPEKFRKRKLDKREWEDVICSVCMEYPHNAVLLLCSSHDNGCRPYMCGTSFKYSNCLEQYNKASAKLISSDREGPQFHKCGIKKLTCPLCRGHVKGWTIVEPVRENLNLKRRSCMQENCSFVGTYTELRKHVKSDHPCARPREVDPTLEQKWGRLAQQRDQDDVVSTIRSIMPGPTIYGDYVIERGTSVSDLDVDDDHVHHNRRRITDNAIDAAIGRGIGSSIADAFLLLRTFRQSGNQTTYSDETNNLPLDDLAISDLMVGAGLDFSDHQNDGFGNYDDGFDHQNDGMPLASRLRRQARRRRNQEANTGSR